MSELTYKDAGVDIDAGEELVDRIGPAVKSTLRPEVLSRVGGFASLVALPGNYRNPVLVAGTDGVGTKLKVAFAVGDHRTIGIDLVAMCANDVLAIGGEPLFFLDYYACSKLEPAAAAQVIEGIAEGCRQAGCALVGGETAELPGFYQPGEYDLAGFLVGVVERDGVIDGHRVAAGDALLGLASSGPHSNGYSLIRSIVDRAGIGWDQQLPGCDRSVGEVLLAPTRIYVGPVLALRAALEIKALAHITGGGLLDNIPRTLPSGLGARLQGDWPVPPVFEWLAEQGPVATTEMRRTFNLGIGMTVVVDAEQVSAAIDLLGEHGVEACQIGEVCPVEPGAPRVTFEGEV